MMTSSNENIFRVTGPLWGNSPVPVNSRHKGQWRGALMFSLICARINDRVNNREAGDLRRLCAHYDVIVMSCLMSGSMFVSSYWPCRHPLFVKFVKKLYSGWSSQWKGQLRVKCFHLMSPSCWNAVSSQCFIGVLKGHWNHTLSKYTCTFLKDRFLTDAWKCRDLYIMKTNMVCIRRFRAILLVTSTITKFIIKQ